MPKQTPAGRPKGAGPRWARVNARQDAEADARRAPEGRGPTMGPRQIASIIGEMAR